MNNPPVYEVTTNGGEAIITISLQRFDYPPISDTDMPALVVAMRDAIAGLPGVITAEATRKEQVTNTATL
ncbi:hypothetical protein ACFYOY_13150 [Streptomyces sp. NPDC007875]|jgi:hypothetical protein|uniref:hypothetical protein n=1 Tax=Streptomyces sp. NPDC007875 TaxID=3364783 RepID=UPI0036B47F6F